METIELIIFLSIAVIIGGLVLTFVVDIDFRSLLEERFLKERPSESVKVDTEGFVREAVRLWEDCGSGAMNLSRTFYISGSGELNSSVLFSIIKANSLCGTLQSAEHSCGRREQVVMNRTVTLPRVVAIRCDSSSQKLIIG